MRARAGRPGRAAAAALALLLGAAPLRAQETVRPFADRVVVTRADIERAGWARLSDALWTSGWALSSVEGFDFDASADGLTPSRLSAAGGPDWTVLVDGQPVPVRVSGVPLLELLPVSIAQVESVTVTRLPSLAAGRIAGRGVIEVHTRRAARPAVRGLYAIGNERGDPGPYRYTSLASANVERLGPDATAAAFAGGARGDLQASVRRSTLNVTDEALLARLDTLAPRAGRELFQKVTSAALRAGVRALGGWHGLVAGGSRFTGLLYQPARESWSTVELSHAGVAGNAAAGALGVRYSATFTRTTADTLAPVRDPALAHARDALDGHLELALRRGGTTLALGGAAARRSARRAGSEAFASDASTYARVAHAPGDTGARWSGEATLGGVRTSEGTALQALGALRVATGARGALALAAGRRPYLAREGDEWIERTVARADTTLPAATPTLTWLDLSWGASLPRAARLELGAGLTRAERWLVRAGAGTTEGDATVADARLVASAPLGAWGAASLLYRLAAPRSSSDAVDAALRATPRHLARAGLSTVEWQHLRASAALTVQSGTRWAAAADSLGAGAALPALVRLDATVEKWLWRHRARVFLAGRNLLDREERYHPAGARFALRVMVGGDVEVW